MSRQRQGLDSLVRQRGRLWLPVLIALGTLVLGINNHPARASAENGPIDAVGRLLIDDRGVCTAFIIRSLEQQDLPHGQSAAGYENWIVSAGHCVGSKLLFVQRGDRLPD